MKLLFIYVRSYDFRFNNSSSCFDTDMSTNSLEYSAVNDSELQLVADKSDEDDIEIHKMQPKIIHAIVNEDNLNNENILEVIESDNNLTQFNFMENNELHQLEKLSKHLDNYKFEPLYELPDINDLLTFKVIMLILI